MAGEVSFDGGAEAAGSVWASHIVTQRVLLTISAVLSFAVFFAIGRVFGIPEQEGYSASLLQQPSPLIALVITAVTLVACTALGSLIAGSVQFEAGLFCAVIGMTALSTRGGPMRYVMFQASGPKIFLVMALELALLFGGVALAWWVLVLLRNTGFLRGEEARYGAAAEEEKIPTQSALALTAQVIVMSFLMVLLTQSDKKAQVLMAVAISALVSSLAAHSLFPARPSAWFLLGPLIVGLLGYVLASMGDGYWTMGEIQSYAPALARPLPLDYASVGTAGAIFGYWTSVRWQMQREHEPETPEQVESSVDRKA